MALVTCSRFRKISQQFFLLITFTNESIQQIQLHSSAKPIYFCPSALHRSFTVHSETTGQTLNSLTLNRFLQDPDPYTQSSSVKLLDLLKNALDFLSENEAIDFLDESGVKPSDNLINLAIWGLKDEWKSAYFVFKWGEKWGCNDEKNWSLIIWILGTNKKFNTAWCLIRDMHRASMDTKQGMLVIIDRYAAANNPSKAIQTFQTMEKFSLITDFEAYYTLLQSLCKNGYIEEAEEFMHLNKKLFPLNSDGFNIILNGWCNIALDVQASKRVWREMSKNCILPNANSYTYMISCFSKQGNLFDSVRLFDEMKKKGWVPALEVYNSLIYVLTRENCVNEALKTIGKIKENGLEPDSNTYNSIIRPLCKSSRFEEARSVLANMIEDNVAPNIDTYHSFLECTSLEISIEMLKRIKKAGLGPNKETFVLVLVKFFELNEPENALKFWAEMKQYNVMPDSRHYKILVEGLINCGLLLKAREIYADMKLKGINRDPKLEKILKEQSGDGKSKSCGVKGQNNKNSRTKIIGRF